MEIAVDFSRSLGPLLHFWQSTGFSPANLLLDADMSQAMAYAGAIPHGGITWARVHYLLELVTADGLGTATPCYHWDTLDSVLSVLVDNGLRPIFELMGNVNGYFTDYTDPAQARAWRDLVRGLAEHVIDRYGQNEVRSWLFETWNEPDIGFWTQGDAAFCAYYDACEDGLHNADPELRLGGPGTCRNLSATLKAFLEHCDTGTNVLTGKPATLPAFISIHEKGVRAHQEDLTPNSMGIVEREARVIDYIREHHPALADLPFMNNECDPQVGWGTTHTWRAQSYYPALAAKIINQHLVSLVDERGVNYAVLSNDNGFLGTWGHRTLLTRFSKTDHIDHGQADGFRDAPRREENVERRAFALIKKPILNLMTLLSLLGDEHYHVEGVGDVSEPLGVIATRRGQSQVAVLVYNSADRVNAGGQRTITLTMKDLPFDRAMLCLYRIDETDGDVFRTWEGLGAPDHPTDDQIDAMRRNQELRAISGPREITIDHGICALDLNVTLPSVTLVLFTTDPGTPPEKVTRLRATTYEGRHGHPEVLLTWAGDDSRALRTYEVLAAAGPGGPYRRVNAVDQLDTAFVHTIDPACSVYSVRAVDFWDRSGDPSDPVHIAHSRR